MEVTQLKSFSPPIKRVTTKELFVQRIRAMLNACLYIIEVSIWRELGDQESGSREDRAKVDE